MTSKESYDQAARDEVRSKAVELVHRLSEFYFDPPTADQLRAYDDAERAMWNLLERDRA